MTETDTYEMDPAHDSSTLPTVTMEELRKEIGKPWYLYGWKSPSILWKRSRLSRWRPFFAWKMRRQRAKRGWSDQDTWGFHGYLENVIIGGTAHLRATVHGHPDGLTFPEWVKILAEIETGFWALKHYQERGHWEPGEEQLVNRAFALLQQWWSHLWD